MILPARRLRSLLLFAARRYEESVTDLTEAIRVAPDDASLRYDRALSLQRLGRHALALEDLDFAVEANPDEHRFRFIRGEARLQAGRPEAAIQDFLKLTQYSGAYYALARAHRAAGQWRDALAAAERFLRTKPPKPQADRIRRIIDEARRNLGEGR